ncbi:dentin sialophosphoprotein-like [Hippoglossus stenolepis]|uniref:dentin sialophosphoprotein-like n=1 Tax=Hippoglossus stenolepis TaxID=195615 RepID=UPI001FAFA999|nr:dentin sialophosphoprotein-like [Hippoglossus stenolepis]
MSHLREDVHSRDYLTTSQLAMRVCPTEDSVHCSTTNSGYSGSMDHVSWDSVEALDSTSATSEWSWCSDLSTDTTCSPNVDETSEELSGLSDQTMDSGDTSVWSSIGDDGTREEVSGCSDLSVDSGDTSVWSSIGDDGTREEVSWSSDEAADVTAAATASSGGKRKLWRRIRKFFSSLTCCCRPKVED